MNDLDLDQNSTFAPDDLQKLLASIPAQQDTPAPINPMVAKYLADKQAMGQAQTQANQNNLLAGLARAGGTLSNAIAGGSKPMDQAGYNALEQSANAPVQNLEKQQASELKGVQTQNALLNAQKEQERQDPNSAESVSFRKAVMATAPEIAKQYGEDFNNLTAADKDNVFDLIKTKETIDARKQGALLIRDNKATDKQNQAMSGTVQLLEQMRGSPAAGQAEKDIYASDKAKTLMSKFSNPNPQMVSLLVGELAKIATGGQPSIHELDSLTPQTLTSSMAGIWQKLTNEPTPANAQAFLKDYMTYADGVSKDAQKVINDRYGRIIESRKGLLNSDQYNTLQNQYVNRFQPQNTTQNDAPRTPSGSDKVKMLAPDGSIRMVPQDQVDAAIKAGGKKV